MAKVKVTVINPNTLRLENDAKKGDTIDLLDVTSVDTTLILDAIKNQKDDVYKKLVAEELSRNNEINQNKLNLEVQNYNNKISELNTKITTIEKGHTKDLESALLKNKQEYQDIITNLEKSIESLRKDHQYVLLQNETYSQNKIKDLENKLNNKDNEFKLIKQIEIHELQNKHNVEYKKIEDELANLKRDKTSNVKRIGENLETWCDNEFMQQHSLMPQRNIVWQKDNEVVGGTKGDFIYKVYASEKLLENELLTSALLEMKSEDPESKTKTTNKSHFKKLDSDRTKKNLEYAILVSELEWNNDSTNDLPIRKVDEYDKMYIVRPQYFMTLLNIIGSFGLKYREILLAKEEERIKFKDIDDILASFEQMKNDILNNSITYINNQLDIIVKQSSAIKDANDKIEKAANLIIERHLETVRNKINDFKINKITNDIKKIN